MEKKELKLIAIPKGEYEGYRVRIVDNTRYYQESEPHHDFSFICEYGKRVRFLWWSWVNWYEFDYFLYRKPLGSDQLAGTCKFKTDPHLIIYPCFTLSSMIDFLNQFGLHSGNRSTRYGTTSSDY